MPTALLLAMCLAAEAAPAPRGGLVAWVPAVPGTSPPLADAMARVSPRTPPGLVKEANVWAARGEAEGFTIVLRAPDRESLRSISVTASALVGPGGREIPSPHVEPYRELFQVVRTPSGRGDPPKVAPGSAIHYLPSRPDGPAGRETPDDPGAGSMCGTGRPLGPPPCFIPDGLVPYKRCTDGSAPPCPGDPGMPLACAVDGTGCGPRAPSMVVPPGTNQPLWIEITVPRGAAEVPAGRYSGAVTVATNAGAVRVPVSLHVWNFELPRSPSFRTALGSNTAPPGARPPRGWIPAEQEYLAKHWMSAMRYGDRPADPGADRRALQTLRPRWGVPNAIAAPFWPGATLRACGRPEPFPTAEALLAWLTRKDVPREVLAYVHDGDELFKEFQAACGDATYAAIRAGARVAHGVGVRVLSVVNPISELAHQDEDGTGPPAVDVFVASPDELFRESPLNRNWPGPDVVSRVRDAGAELWTYQVWIRNAWGPKWQLDWSPVSYRLGFVAQALGISGALMAEYWTGAQAHENPWRDGLLSRSGAGTPTSDPMNGDSQLLYPGAPVGLGATPTASLRLKMFRDGIEDYELIRMLSRRGGAAYDAPCPDHEVTCRALVQALGGTDYSDYSTDTHALQRARRAIGDQVSNPTESRSFAPGTAEAGVPQGAVQSPTRPRASASRPEAARASDVPNAGLGGSERGRAPPRGRAAPPPGTERNSKSARQRPVAER